MRLTDFFPRLRLAENVTGNGNVQGIMQVGPVTFDQVDGIGQVPMNANLKYMGFATLMTARQFAGLAAFRSFEASSLDYLTEALKQGQAFGSPFLEVVFASDRPARVAGHEGRTRCKAIEIVYGPQTPILVHIFLGGGLRARHLSLEQIAAFRATAIPEKLSTAMAGPHFAADVWWRDGWHSLPK